MTVATSELCFSFLLISLFFSNIVAYPSKEEYFVKDESVDIYGTVVPEATTLKVQNSYVENNNNETTSKSNAVLNVVGDTTPFVVVDDNYGVIGGADPEYETSSSQWESAQEAKVAKRDLEGSGHESVNLSESLVEESTNVLESSGEEPAVVPESLGEKPAVVSESSGEKPAVVSESLGEKLAVVSESSGEDSTKPEASGEESVTLTQEPSKKISTEESSGDVPLDKESNTSGHGNQNFAVSVRADDSGEKSSKCTGFAQCFSSADCGGGKSVCLGVFVGTCNCNACFSGIPCTSDTACGGLKNACAKSGFCNCIQAHVTNGFSSFGTALLEFCNHRTCTHENAGDVCFGLPCNSGRCACEKA